MKVISIHKESEIKDFYLKELINNKVFNHSLYYLSDKISDYNDRRKNEYDNKSIESTFFKKHLGSQLNNISFISLGCGDSMPEYHLLNELSEFGIKYYAIDCSEYMLKESHKNLKEIKLKKIHILADFIRCQSFGRLVTDFDLNKKKLFIMNGGTFGNFSLNKVDHILSFLNKSDYIYIDIVSYTTKEEVNKLNTRYEDTINHSDEVFKTFFETLGIDHSKGKFILDKSVNSLLGAINYHFKFIPISSIEKYNIGKHSIDVLNIFAYEEKSLIKMFKGKNFEFMGALETSRNTFNKKYLFKKG
ncbi:L-histidine N(alpha)-methyltransferase [Thiotrichales bacterium 19S3-7]|nr:L-histidine N(alpha)-methyltransferase [Thiotrichales bacterium 19S3-7]MCF6802924.1 L-histidine N(alpha)-methyltransferase [Thiotrichales bacterium 19S3-11]